MGTYQCRTAAEERIIIGPTPSDDGLILEWSHDTNYGSVILDTDVARCLALEILTLIGDEETAAKIRMLLQ